MKTAKRTTRAALNRRDRISGLNVFADITMAGTRGIFFTLSGDSVAVVQDTPENRKRMAVWFRKLADDLDS